MQHRPDIIAFNMYLPLDEAFPGAFQNSEYTEVPVHGKVVKNQSPVYMSNSAMDNMFESLQNHLLLQHRLRLTGAQTCSRWESTAIEGGKRCYRKGGKRCCQDHSVSPILFRRWSINDPRNLDNSSPCGRYGTVWEETEANILRLKREAPTSSSTQRNLPSVRSCGYSQGFLSLGWSLSKAKLKYS